MKTYIGKITKLNTNQIFVFGSNTQGRHGKGAALDAVKNFGAIYGQSKGLQGKSYAIVTKDLTKKIHPSIKQSSIKYQIQDLYNFADENEDLEFLIVYNGKGTNLNGYTNLDMAKMFYKASLPEGFPKNIVFEKEFYNLILEYKTKSIF